MQLHEFVEARNVAGVKSTLSDPAFDPNARPKGFAASWNVASAAIMSVDDAIRDSDSDSDDEDNETFESEEARAKAHHDARHILALLMADARIERACDRGLWDMITPAGRVFEAATWSGRDFQPEEFE